MNIFKEEFYKRAFTGIIILFCFIGSYLHSATLFNFLLSIILVIILFFEWPQFFSKTRTLMFFGITILYPIMPVFLLILLNKLFRSQNFIFPLYPFFIAWISDTFGYFVGKQIGYHKICPQLSPGKSWEGLVGSFIGVLFLHVCLLKYIIVYPFYQIGNNVFLIIVYSLVITGISFIGGLLISYFKRINGLKDSGNILPGHGGLLDRFDSVFLIIIFIWILIALFSLYDRII